MSANTPANNLPCCVRIVVVALVLSSCHFVRADNPTEKPNKHEAKARADADIDRARVIGVRDGQPSQGHLEQPDDDRLAPAAQRGELRTAPPAKVVRGQFVSVQVNTDAAGNNILGDAANEPSIAVDPTDRTHIAIGWRQFDNVQSNFRQAGWAYSQNGGQTWTFPGVLTPGIFRSDPVLASDANGVFYYNSLQSDFSTQMFRSFDGGVTWQSPVEAFGGDKLWMIIDTTSSVGRGHVYLQWSLAAGCCGSDVFTRSTDGGLTYLNPIAVPTTPFWGTLTVDPDGRLYISDNASGNLMNVIRSSDARFAGVTPTFDLIRTVNIGGSTAFSTGPNPAGLLGQVWIASDHSQGPTHGNIYVLASVDPPGSDPLDVMFTRSTDQGLTWSSPVRVNDDPFESFAYQWFGTMSVAPSGRIDAVWNDTRADSDAIESELYYAYSMDGGVTWSPNIAVSPPFNHFLGYPNQDKLGDYYDMISDETGVNVAYAATFNGEQDVYFLRINAVDCNENGIEDPQDITGGTSLDCDTNGVPDECQFDCNTNGIPDTCDLIAGTGDDCNSDLVPDECQLAGNDCNADAVLDECQEALLVVQPPGVSFVCPGETATLHVIASDPNVTFRWLDEDGPLFDGGRLSGTGTDTLMISDANPFDEGLYRCRITLGCLTADSEPGAVQLKEAATVLDPPDALIQRCAMDSASFAVTAGGTGPFDYIWLKNGVPFGANNSRILLLHDLTTEDEGEYSCRIINDCGQAVSTAGRLELVDPVFTVQPADQCALAGETVELSGLATAGMAPGYWWEKNGEVLDGQFEPTLILSDVTEADEGTYQLYTFLPNSPFCVAVSEPAVLQVDDCAPDCNSNGVADDLDILAGTSTDDNLNGSPDECESITAVLSSSNDWIYTSMSAVTGCELTFDVTIENDPLANASYSFEWTIALPEDANDAPVVTGGGENDDSFLMIRGPECGLDGLSPSGQSHRVRVVITGDTHGNKAVVERPFAIVLLGDVNNDGVVNVTDRSIINARWRGQPIGSYDDVDADLDCDGQVNVLDRSIANAIWRGATSCDNGPVVPPAQRDTTQAP